MKLIRFGEAGRETPGIIMDDAMRLDVSALVRDYDEAFFASDGLPQLKQWLTENEASAPRVPQSVRLGPPIARPSKIVCIGLNFRDHAQESKMEIPKEPVIFFKATTSLVGPNDDLLMPKDGQKVDWEVELAVVIGKRGTYVEREEALEYVAGYVLTTIIPNAHFNSSGADNGSRERVRIHLRHWGQSWQHVTRFPTPAAWECGLKLTASRDNIVPPAR